MTATTVKLLPDSFRPSDAGPRFVWSLPPDLTAGPFARRLLSTVCVMLGVLGEQADDIVAMGHELASNAIEHALGPYEIRLQCGGDLLFCEIANGGDALFHLPAAPQRELALADIDAADVDGLERGRGLWQVTVLSNGRCGVRPTLIQGLGGAVNGVAAWFAVPATLQSTQLRPLDRPNALREDG